MLRTGITILAITFVMGFLYCQPEIIWRAVVSHYLFSRDRVWFTFVMFAAVIWFSVCCLFPSNNESDQKRTKQLLYVLSSVFILHYFGSIVAVFVPIVPGF